MTRTRDVGRSGSSSLGRRLGRASLGRLRRAALVAVAAPVCAGGATALVGVVSSPAAAASVAASRSDRPTSASWCASHGSSLVGWTGTLPDLPICGIGPAYGGTDSYVDLPGPGGATTGYYGATPGFQCVELAERFLAVVYGLAPIEANGESVAANYHAAYPDSSLYVNGSSAAVGHAPQPGDVLSVASVPSFQGYNDGHVAVVVKSDVDRSTGDGAIVVAQENVSGSDYTKTIDVVDWRLEDPAEPSDPEFQFPYAEWLDLGPIPSVAAAEAAARRTVAEGGLDLRLAQAGLLALVTVQAGSATSPLARFERRSPALVTTGVGLPVAGSSRRLAVPGAP